MGDIIITSTNTNPASALGGTWELVDKDFKELYSNTTDDDTYFVRNKANTSTVSTVIARRGHDLFLRIIATMTVDISDSAIEIGTLNLENIGITSMYTMQNVAYSDGGNGIAFCSLNGTNGVLATVDRLTRTNVDIPAGQNFAVIFNQPIRTNLMLDEACDKFYWKRTT